MLDGIISIYYNTAILCIIGSLLAAIVCAWIWPYMFEIPSAFIVNMLLIPVLPGIIPGICLAVAGCALIGLIMAAYERSKAAEFVITGLMYLFSALIYFIVVVVIKSLLVAVCRL
jgi:hypothetical protein